jgi:hypothetical protein
MATVFLVKDGPRGDRTDEGRDKTVEELTSLLTSHNCLFLTEEPPEFNTAQPGDYYRHVVIEITPKDQTNNKFPRFGFYIVENLDTSQSIFLFE